MGAIKAVGGVVWGLAVCLMAGAAVGMGYELGKDVGVSITSPKPGTPEPPSEEA
jgi:hypothetical protein